MAATTDVDPFEWSEDGSEVAVDNSHIDDKGECTLSHKNYTTDLTSHLNQLRKEETLCDITIIVNQRRLLAHKVVLCAASSYFTAMFTSGFQETNQTEITIDGNAEAFKRLLDFAYTGVIQLNCELVSDVISTASYLQFNEVVPLCANFLSLAYTKKLIRLPDAFNILNMAALHKFHLLKKHAETYLAENFVEFSETDVFLKEASHDYVESVLKRKDLVLWAKEEQILKGVVAWLKHDWRSRKQYTVPFLRLIRLGLVPVATLKQAVDSNVQVIPECREMVDEVEKCLALEETSKTPLSFQFPHLFASRGMEKTLISINPAVDSAAHHTHCYNQSGWHALHHFPHVPFNLPFEGHRLVVAQGQLYLIGGRYMTDQIPSYARQPSLIEMCNYFLRYDSGSNKWEKMEDMGVSRSHCATVSLGNFIYVISGWSLVSTVTDVERFNLTENKWETLEPMPKCQSIPVAVVFRDNIIVHSVENRVGGQVGHITCYDQRRNLWHGRWHNLVTYNKSSPRSRRMSSAPLLVVHEDRLYVVSYRSNGVACVQEVVIYEDEIGRMNEAEVKEPQDLARQEDVAQHGPRAFCIGDQQFANLNGYPFKLHPWVLQQFASTPRRTLSNMIEQLEREACCLEFDLDCYSLMSKGS